MKIHTDRPTAKQYGYTMNEIPDALHPILHHARLKHIPRGQILLYETDVPHDVFVIKQGVVKIYDIDEQGNEKILHIVKSPALIPFAFFSGQNNPLKWFYATITECDVYVMPFDAMQEAVFADATISKTLTNAFSSDVHELLVRLSSLSKTNARDKLYAALTFLSTKHATKLRDGWCRVTFPVSHQLLADLSGVTRESAATVMKDLVAEKIIRNPRVTILEIHQEKLYKKDAT